MPHWTIIVAAWYALASVVSAALYAIDKRRAVRNASGVRRARSRIPERTLHAADLAGGWPGGLLARRALRHKTDARAKRRFVWTARAIVCLHALAWLAVLALSLRS
ncbi:MAG: DUF1294 domain-containing protein [Phycisphaeraceae bacterium]|nr:DUF1294 domain-containing protein [Phycisphaeraceae bacterium]